MICINIYIYIDVCRHYVCVSVIILYIIYIIDFSKLYFSVTQKLAVLQNLTLVGRWTVTVTY